MTELRIFSYLPNPRIWKATIAARLCGLDVEVRGASPKELESWLWDFDARPLTQVDRKLQAFPSVPPPLQTAPLNSNTTEVSFVQLEAQPSPPAARQSPPGHWPSLVHGLP